MFETYLLASGATEFSPERRRAILIQCLGTEGQRIFNTLPATAARMATASAEKFDAATTPATSADKPDATGAPTAPNVYDVAVAALRQHFASTSNVVVERHRFHRRYQSAKVPQRASFILVSAPVSCCHFLASVLCRSIVMCRLLLQQFKHFSVPFFQLLLPGCSHRSLLLSQLLRCQFHNILSRTKLHPVMCSLSLCRRSQLPVNQPGDRSENGDLSIVEGLRVK
ncbi:hypothetical protein MTO96_045132 [Rhipicephalus appendiculatus]